MDKWSTNELQRSVYGRKSWTLHENLIHMCSVYKIWLFYGLISAAIEIPHNQKRIFDSGFLWKFNGSSANGA